MLPCLCNHFLISLSSARSFGRIDRSPWQHSSKHFHFERSMPRKINGIYGNDMKLFRLFVFLHPRPVLTVITKEKRRQHDKSKRQFSRCVLLLGRKMRYEQGQKGEKEKNIPAIAHNRNSAGPTLMAPRVILSQRINNKWVFGIASDCFPLEYAIPAIGNSSILLD